MNDDLIMIINKDTRNDPRFPRFLAAVKEGSAYIKAHPDAAWGLFIHAYPNLNNKLNRDAWNFTIPYFAADPAALDQAKYIRFGQYLAATKVIKAAPPLSALAVQLK
jgi:putative hydroxymethylpyrimidine transport system substrate-binding protein